MAAARQMDGAQAGQGHGGQRDRENRHRAEQHQPQDRVRGDDLRLQRRVDPRVVADGDGDAGNQGRDGLPTGIRSSRASSAAVSPSSTVAWITARISGDGRARA